MNVSGKLALAYAWRHPARMFLTSLATIASACVVVWVVSGYDALVGQFGSQASEYLGRYDLFLVPDAAEDSSLPAELVDAMRQDAAIAEWEPALQWTGVFRRQTPLAVLEGKVFETDMFHLPPVRLLFASEAEYGFQPRRDHLHGRRVQ